MKHRLRMAAAAFPIVKFSQQHQTAVASVKLEDVAFYLPFYSVAFPVVKFSQYDAPAFGTDGYIYGASPASMTRRGGSD